MIGALASIVLDPFGSESGRPGPSASLLVLAAFILSFLFIRTSTRLIRAQVSWWPGNIETSSGLHLHHLVWGIGLMLVCGFIGYSARLPSPWFQIAAVGFGIGAGLTVDEFALWLHLKDVYWSDEGRISLDAVILVAAFMLLVALGVRPFGLQDDVSMTVVVAAMIQALVLSVISFLKGRIALGVIAIFVPLFGLWAAFRLAKPWSPWARSRYDEAKLGRARARYPDDRRSVRMRERFLDAIGGRPTEPDPPA